MEKTAKKNKKIESHIRMRWPITSSRCQYKQTLRSSFCNCGKKNYNYNMAPSNCRQKQHKKSSGIKREKERKKRPEDCHIRWMSLHWKVRQGGYVSWAEKPVWRGSVSPWRLTCPQNRVEMEWGLGQRLLLPLSLCLSAHIHTLASASRAATIWHLDAGTKRSAGLGDQTISLLHCKVNMQKHTTAFCVYCEFIFARNTVWI